MTKKVPAHLSVVQDQCFCVQEAHIPQQVGRWWLGILVTVHIHSRGSRAREMEILLIKKKEKKSVTDECSSSMANYFKLYNSPWHFLRAQRHSLGEWREKENPKHSAKRSKRRQMSMKLTTGPLNRAQAKLPTYPLPTRALTSYPQAGPGETGRRATLAEGRVSCSRPPSAVEKCGGPHSCRLHVVSLQEISVLDGKLELLRLGGEDTGVKLGRGGRRGGRGF